MILVDTNIIIDFWKDINFKNENIFNDYEIAICPIVKVEIIHGAKSYKFMCQSKTKNFVF